MHYNGKELDEMTIEEWDGKPRRMLAWNDDEKTWSALICGYNPLRKSWICAETSISFSHCAEIPSVAEEDVMKLLNDNENELLALKAENDELKAKIKSLRVERGEMANAVSSAVWKELMNRAEQNKVIGSLQLPAGFGFNDISDIVLNKIIDYKPEKKLRRMTYKELDEWLKEGKGVCKMGYLSNKISYPPSMKDDEVKEGILICAFGNSNFEEPLIGK